MNTRWAREIADAVLYEGYALYPYRASAAKNRLRWQVGLVTPREYAEATGADPWFTQTECLVEAGPGAALTVHVRCLHVQERRIEQPSDSAGTTWVPRHAVTVDDRQLITWDEAVAAELVRDALPLDGIEREWRSHWVLDEATSEEPVHDRTGRLAARIVRRRSEVVSLVRVRAEPHGGIVRIQVRVENVTPCGARDLAARDTAVRQSLAGTHTVLAIENGAFVSLLDPPEPAAELARSCTNTGTFPVLVGPAGSRTMMLSSPIILYDYPVVAPESPGDLFDGTEIDEMLMLRVRTLSDHEKLEARATDARAAEIIDRCDAASPETLAGLHGAVRHLDAGGPSADWESFVNPPHDEPPEAASVHVGEARIGRGSRVRLAPSHRADTLDLCLRGRLATVTAVYRTLEDEPYVAVALDDDPFAASGLRYRRSLFFHPDELVPLDSGARGPE